MSTTLYELANAREILDGWLFESEGELTPELETLLNELEGKADEKIERVALYIREQLATAKAIKEEEERLRQRRSVREKAAESLKLYLHAQMDRLGKTKVEGLLATIAIQNNPPAVQVDPSVDEGTLRNWTMFAPEFVTHNPETFAVNKRAVLDAAKSKSLPKEVAALVHVTQSQSLRIR